LARTSSRKWLAVLLLCALCGGSAAASGAPMFTEVAAAAGVRHKHEKPLFDQRLAKVMPWITSLNAGAAVGDFNGDGRPDLYVVNSRAGTPNALYRNNGDMTFTDVAAEQGVASVNTEDGVSVDPAFGDIDNDGDQDLFVAGYGHSRLFRNDGGRFTDITKAAGLGAWGNASCAVFVDYDGDGLLDILVGHYFDRGTNLWDIASTRVLPESFIKAHNGGGLVLYRNVGNNTFADVTARAGLAGKGWTLDVGCADIDNDGDPDIYAADDYGEDFVYRNNGDGTFTNVTRQSTGGDFDAGMNVDFGDYDNDGYMDVYVTNITNRYIRQGNMLWHNLGDGTFVNVAQEAGCADGGWAWGAKFFDFDNDGLLDIYNVNGYVTDGPVDLFAGSRLGEFFNRLSSLDISDVGAWPDMRGFSISAREKHRLFRNTGAGFREMAEAAGVADTGDGRGVALADFDGDGDLDIFVTNCGQPAVLYRNDVGASRHWLQVRLVGTRSNRDAVGARLSATAGDLRQTREVDGGNGFSAQSSRVVQFGLGDHERVDALEIRWPSGTRQTLKDVAADQRLTITEPAPPRGREERSP